jgi:hypothetical protein
MTILRALTDQDDPHSAVALEATTDGKLKIDSGGGGTVTLGANSGVDIGDVDVTSLPPLPAGENHTGAVGGHTVQIDTGIVVDTAVYASGDVMGGKLTLTNAMRVSGGSGILQSVFVQDAANQKPAFELLIFNSDPSAGTYADNAAFTYHVNDRVKCIRRISIMAADYVTLGGVAIADLSPGGRALVASGSRHLYAICVLTSAPDFAATSDLVIRLGILQD